MPSLYALELKLSLRFEIYNEAHIESVAFLYDRHRLVLLPAYMTKIYDYILPIYIGRLLITGCIHF